MKSIVRQLIAAGSILALLSGCLFQSDIATIVPTPIVVVHPSEPTLKGADAIVASTLSVQLPKHLYAPNEPIVATLRSVGWYRKSRKAYS
jgi:hypothetical protein